MCISVCVEKQYTHLTLLYKCLCTSCVVWTVFWAILKASNIMVVCVSFLFLGKAESSSAPKCFVTKLCVLEGKLKSLRYHNGKVQGQFTVQQIKTKCSVNFLIHKYLPIPLIRFSGRFQDVESLGQRIWPS